MLYEGKGGQKTPVLVYKQVLVSGDELTDAQAAFDQRSGEPVLSTSRYTHAHSSPGRRSLVPHG